MMIFYFQKWFNPKNKRVRFSSNSLILSERETGVEPATLSLGSVFLDFSVLFYVYVYVMYKSVIQLIKI